MKTLKKIMCVLLLALTLTNCKNSSKENNPLYPIIKGLSNVHVDNMPKIDTPIEALDAYTNSGKKLSQEEKMKMLGKGYTYTEYMNKDKVSKLIVIKVPKLKIGEPMPDFDLTDINGNTYTLNSLKGKVVVFNFWFIACSPCVAEMPDLNKLVKQYETNENVVFLGLALDSDRQIKRFLKRQDFKYNLVSAEAYIRTLEITSFPRHIIMDKNSNLVFKNGPRSNNVLSKNIDELLK